MDNHKEILEKTIKELLEKMDFGGDVAVVEGEEGTMLANIQSDEAGFLIGQGGENLSAMQHLARAITNRRTAPNLVNFTVDINNYRAHRLDLLKEMALELASQAEREQHAKILEPMPSYERRFIHLVLKDFKGIKTESQGEGMERRIVIKPADTMNG